MKHETEQVITVIQGDFAISDGPQVVLTTVLGSCIAVCLHDRNRRIGGMNHFLLAGGGDRSSSLRYGTNAMELLINGLLKRGSDRGSLEAKIFGGASILGNGRNIGASNAEFARDFLRDEAIPCLAESTGGSQARRIRFWPADGRVRQLVVPDIPDEPLPVAAVAPARDVELF